MIEPYKGKIYDPCCGSGGMFVQSMKFIENHKGNTKDISVYGQEYTGATYKLAKMNLAIRGISANLGAAAKDTFANDQHETLKADFIMANPPFNQKDWRASDELVDDHRWDGYETPQTGNANYGWILHMVSKLSANGVAGFILSNGALSGDGTEKEIRKKLIENNLVEAIIILPRNMFYTTDISVTLWILNKNKKAHTVPHEDVTRHYRDREEEVLFMDLRQRGEPFEKKYLQFSEQDIKDFADTLHTWQQVGADEHYQDIAEYCYSATKEEIAAKDYSLVPSKHIEFTNRDENINFEDKMNSLKGEFSELLAQEEQSKNDLLNVLKSWAMRSNYKKLGQFIKDVSVKNKALEVELLLGVSITKRFIPSIANTVGTDMSKYKIVKQHQFAYGPVTSRNGEKISVALLEEDKCIVSTSYTVFEIVDT